VGEPRFSSVYSVGLCWCQPAASRRWRRGRSGVLGRRSSSSVVMLRWSFAADRPSSSRLQVRGAAVRASPRRRPSSGGSGLVALLEGVGVVGHGVRVDGARWRLFGVRGPATSRLLGGTSDPRLKGGGAAARRRNVSLGVDEDEIQKDLIVISLSVLGLSVRSVA
jgi:hypothetical protein